MTYTFLFAAIQLILLQNVEQVRKKKWSKLDTNIFANNEKHKNTTAYYVIILLCEEKNNIIIVHVSVVNNHIMNYAPRCVGIFSRF